MCSLIRTSVLFLILFSISFSSGAQEKYILVFLNRHQKEENAGLQNKTLVYSKLMREDRRLLLVGWFRGGGELLILNTASTKEAKNWLNTNVEINPAREHIEVLPWSRRKGSICPVAESGEMAFYTFIRYNSNITKFNVQQAPELFRAHDVYIKKIIKTGNVVSEGVFGNNDGSTMIMKGEVGREVIVGDPAVQNGILEPEIKMMWVPKGVFCE